RPNGMRDLNGDGDDQDYVLFVYDLQTDAMLNTGQAAITCPLESCNPRQPYRVLHDTVQFLTLESDQNEDLDGNGSKADLVLQLFNARLAESAGAGAASPHPLSRTKRAAGSVRAGALTTIGAVAAGVCTDTGTACASASDCHSGRCFLPP